MSSNNKAYSYCIKLLTKRDYSRVKLIQKLQLKGFEHDEIQVAIESLLNRNFLREDFYIEARVKGLMLKNYSPDFIQERLRQESLDVPLADIESVFIDQGLSTEKQIERLIVKKMPLNIPIDSEKQLKLRDKIIRHLLSKGHCLSDVKSKVIAAFSQAQKTP